MKLYIWKRKGANRSYNFYPLSKAESVGEGGFYAIACHAFFKKKEAIKYINSIWDKDVIKYYELISVNI